MPDGALTLGGQLGGVTFDGNVIRAGTSRETTQTTLDVALSGTLSTRTDNNTGIVTVAAHAITTDMSIALYWDGGCRRNMDVTAVGGSTTISIDLGDGDNLPLVATAVTIQREYTVNMDFTAAEAIAAAIQMSRRGQVDFQQGDGTSVWHMELNGDGGGDEQNDFQEWHLLETGGFTTPFGANVGKIIISNGSSDGSNVVKIGVSLDNVS